MSFGAPRRTAFAERLVAQALAEREAGAPMADADEMAAAHRSASSQEGRILTRAWLLAGRSGLLAQWAALRRLMALPVLAWAGLVALSSYGILRAVIGEGRSINLMLAFVSVLGLHALALGLWGLSFLGPRGGGSGLGAWTVQLLGRVVSPDKAALIAAGTTLLQRAGLAPWAFGLFSHLVWACALGLVLLGLMLAFAFHAFQLSWETTILQADFFVDFIRVAGWLPAQLGLPVVDPALLRESGDAAVRHRGLAWWLIGCTLVYGLLPRLLLLALCGAVCTVRRNRLQLDPSAPWVRRLATRFEQMDRSAVIDVEQRPAGQGERAAAGRQWPRRRGGAERLAIVGFELPPEAPWPPPQLTLEAPLSRPIAGSGEEREALPGQLAAMAITQVLLVVDGAASPDRGTAHFLQVLMSEQRALALLLVAPPARLNARRWTGWLHDIGQPALPVFTTADEARRWALGSDG